MKLSSRQQEILVKALELYISTGTPVGSHSLSEFVEASSSTIRTELAYLESVGLLTQPHTSAGRLPTDAGYRFYVDALIPEDTEKELPAGFFEASQGSGNVDELLRGVSEEMSEVTRLLAVVAGPGALGDPLSRVDFLPLSQESLLLVVSMDSGASTSTTLSLPVPIEEGELREIFSGLNSWLEGRPLGADLELALAGRKVLADHHPLVVRAVLDAVEVLGRATERGVFIQGVSALLARLDDLDPSSLTAVIEIFERRRWLLRLMGDALKRSVSNPHGVVVSIGAESGFYNLEGTSFVAAAYSHHERPYGVVSLIGPKRMEYGAAITTVRSAAESLTTRLSGSF